MKSGLGKMSEITGKKMPWILILVLNATAFITAFIGSAVNLAVPAMGRQFGHPSLTVGWVVSSFIIASVVVLVPLGALSDRHNFYRRIIYLAGVTLFTLASFLCPLSSSLAMLIFFRSLQGIASGAIYATSLAILTENVPPSRRGRVIGLNVSSVYTGLSVGPVLGGWVTHTFGWQGVFYLTGVVGTAVAVSAWRILPAASAPGAKESARPLRWLDALLFMFGITMVMLGFSSLTAFIHAWLLLVGGAVLIGFFTYFELQREHPLMNLRLFADPGYAFSNLAALISYAATFAVGFLLSIYLQDVRGYTSATAGTILLAQPVVMAIVAPLAGRWSDKIQPRTLASWGMGLTAAALFALGWLSLTVPIIVVVTALAVLGFGFGLFSSPNANAVMSCVTTQFYGVAGSTLATMRVLGNTFSMSLVMFLAGIMGAMTVAAPVEAVIAFVRLTFIVFAALCSCGVFLSMKRGHIVLGEGKNTRSS